MTIEIVAVAGLALVEDGGRPGFMHLGIPPGGALVPRDLARANHHAGNAWNFPAIEIIGKLSVVASEGMRVATDEGPTMLDAGQRLDVGSTRDRRVRYLAFHGGLDVPFVHGGRGTLLVAGLGGFEGRGLRRGDRIALGRGGEEEEEEEAARTPGSPRDEEHWEEGQEEALRVIPGPDLVGAMPLLLSSVFTLSPASDRMGARLEGTRLPSEDIGRSMPMVAGAIQVPPSGAPIVLGPDHPTTGGYPLIAVLGRGELGRLYQRALGAPVRFRV
ncbi:MAG: allophanate hydrolase subunit 2 family protein [Polyangiaceae bacterium]